MVGGKDLYNGQSKNGMAHDIDEMTYMGMVVRCGPGLMKYSSGGTYKGEWENEKA